MVKDEEELEEKEELEEVLDEIEEDIELADIIEDSEAPGGFVSRSNFQAPEVSLVQDGPVENLDNLPDVSPRPQTLEEEGGTQADYATASSSYSGMQGNDGQSEGYAGAGYAGMQEGGATNQLGMPRRQIDSQMDVTGGALRMDESAIRQQGIGFEDRQRVVNPRDVSQEFSQHSEYVSRSDRFEVEKGSPFQQRSRKRKWF